jgi:hypothetical protein
MSMTPDAKKLLATTIRALRARLLANLAARTQSVYQLDLKAKDANLDEATACKRRRLEEHLDDEVRAQRGRDKPRDWCRCRRRRLRAVIEALNDPELATVLDRRHALGWVYQYWNDPEREASTPSWPPRQARAPRDRQQDADVHRALHGGLAAAEHAGADVAGDVQAARLARGGRGLGGARRLEARRVAWRARREAGEVALTELMPLHPGSSERWAYWVPQPLPADAVARRRRASAI